MGRSSRWVVMEEQKKNVIQLKIRKKKYIYIYIHIYIYKPLEDAYRRPKRDCIGSYEHLVW